MAPINSEYLVEAQPNELELLELTQGPRKPQLKKIHYQQVLPNGQITDTSPIQFIMSGQNGMESIGTKRSFNFNF